MNAVIIVPWRDKGDRWRRTNLHLVLTHLKTLDVAPIVCVSDGRTGNTPFNRSAAYNLGLRQNPDAQCYVFHEADMIIDAEQLQKGIDAALKKPGMVVPFTDYHYLSQYDTERIHTSRRMLEAKPEYVMISRATGAINIASAETMRMVGQWDELFHGWGYDDRAMARAFHVVTKTPTRYIMGAAQHLWHTPGWSKNTPFRGGTNITPPEQEATDDNKRRYELYRNTRDPHHMRLLTSGKDVMDQCECGNTTYAYLSQVGHLCQPCFSLYLEETGQESYEVVP
jgi:hypothetical protein